MMWLDSGDFGLFWPFFGVFWGKVWALRRHTPKICPIEPQTEEFFRGLGKAWAARWHMPKIQPKVHVGMFRKATRDNYWTPHSV